MAAVSYNTEELPKLKRAKEILESIRPTMKKGVENSVEIAKDSGAPKYIASGESMAENVPALVDQTIPETIEAIGNMIKYYERLENAL